MIGAQIWRGIAAGDADLVERQRAEAGLPLVSPEWLLVECWLAATRDQRPDYARRLWREALQAPSGSELPEAAERLLKRLPELGSGLEPLRIAVLGSGSTRFFTWALRLYALRDGFEPQLYEAPYGQLRQELLDPNSGFYRHRPEAVFLLPELEDGSWRELDGEAIAAEFERLWSRIDQLEPAPLIFQTGFWSRLPDPLGHLGATLPEGRTSRLRALHMSLHERAGRRVHWLDMEVFFAAWGQRRLHAPRYDHLAKQALTLDGSCLLAHEASRLLAAARGKRIKCVILDLDHTLWGGIVGEDGADGLQLGAGSPEGEAFFAFQAYLKAVKETGVLLAIASKNEPESARAVFARRGQEMALGLADFAALEIGWMPKAESIARIARSLRIGTSACLFIDDNPSELEQIRRLLPEVAVWPFPADPADAPGELAACRFFEAASFSREDELRTSDLQRDHERRQLKEASGSLDDFYRSLRVQIRIEPVAPHFERVLQLINKTNQFNLTTRRFSEAGLRSQLESGGIAFCAAVCDKFSDSGITGVVLASPLREGLEVELFLMSCRVIGKTVEASMLEALLRLAQARATPWVEALYLPSAQNASTAEFWERAGFELLERSDDGAKRLRLILSELEPLKNPFAELSFNPEFTHAEERGA